MLYQYQRNQILLQLLKETLQPLLLLHLLPVDQYPINGRYQQTVEQVGQT